MALYAGRGTATAGRHCRAVDDLIDGPSLATEASPAIRDIPIFMAHGTQDPVVQFAWAEMSRRALVEGGWNVEWHTYPMATPQCSRKFGVRQVPGRRAPGR